MREGRVPLLVDAEPASVTATRSKRFFIADNLVKMALCTVSLVLVLILHLRTPVAPTPAPCPEVVLVADNTTCGETDDCNQGFRSAANDTCTYYTRSSNTPCRLTCARPDDAEGTCNAVGECAGDETQCPGNCEANGDCSSDMFDESVIFSYDPETYWTFSSWHNPYGCSHGMCVWGTTDIYVVSTEYAILTETNLTKGWWPGAARFQCLDYINPSVRAMYPDCFRTERYLLSPHLIDYSLYSDGIYGNGTFPFQVSFCIISYKCSRPRVTDLSSASSSSFVRPLSARGLTLIESSGVGSDIRDPVLRNLLYDEIEEMMLDSLPGFLSAVFAGKTIVPAPG